MRSAALLGLTLTLAAGASTGALAAKTHTSKPTLRATTGTTLLGNSAIASLSDAAPAGEAEAFPFVAAASGDAQSLSFYLDSGNASTSVGAAIYTNSRSKPKNLLAQGFTSTPTAGAWNTVPVTTTSLVSGRKYWIALLGKGGTLRIRDEYSSTCQDYSSSSSTLTSFPSTFTTGAKWNSCSVSAFASTAPAPTTTTTTTTPTSTTTTSTTTTTTSPTTTTTTSPTTTTTGACTVSASPSTLSSVFSNAAAGAVICLDSGSYGTFAGGSKSGMVTLTPATGASPSISIALGSGAKNIRFDGFQNFGGWDINASQNIEILNTKFTSPMQVRGATSGILFDNDTFDGLGHGTWEGRLSFGQGAGNAIVRNSHLGNGGCADGIQMNGSAHDILIQGNTFTGIRQGTCTEHADPIQFYGATRVQILSNYFYNNSTGIMNADGNGSPMTATNNVWVMDEYPYAIAGSGLTASTINHNVVVGPANISLTAGNAGSGTGNTLQNNVSAFILGSGSNTVDHNLTQDKVTFRGGSGRCAYALTSTSTGHNAGSDGTDIGLNNCP